MKKILTIFVMSLVIFSLGFAVANENNLSGKENLEVDDVECSLDTDCPTGFSCDDYECEKIEVNEEEVEDNLEVEKELREQKRDRMESEGEFNEQGKEGIMAKYEFKERHEYRDMNGNMFEIEVEEKMENGVFERKVKIKEKEFFTDLELEFENESEFEDEFFFKAKLSNGKDSEIKIMPDVASERALERLRLKVCNESEGCMIELKEVGNGNESKFVYEMKRDRKAKFLGFIGTSMNVEAQVDADTGEVIKTRKPWWSFLASEPEEILTE